MGDEAILGLGVRSRAVGSAVGPAACHCRDCLDWTVRDVAMAMHSSGYFCERVYRTCGGAGPKAVVVHRADDVRGGNSREANGARSFENVEDAEERRGMTLRVCPGRFWLNRG